MFRIWQSTVDLQCRPLERWKNFSYSRIDIVPLYATYANAPSGTNIENIEKNSIYGTFGTEMPHGTLAQVAQTSYMKGEFLYQLFIIMSINL